MAMRVAVVETFPEPNRRLLQRYVLFSNVSFFGETCNQLTKQLTYSHMLLRCSYSELFFPVKHKYHALCRPRFFL